MSEYFIKRGEKIHGPFSTKQVKSELESGKLKDADLISERKDGPWQTVDLLQEPVLVAEVIAEDVPKNAMNEPGFWRDPDAGIIDQYLIKRVIDFIEAAYRRATKRD